MYRLKHLFSISRNYATKPVYMDYQATTPVDPRVYNAMIPYLKEEFGNPHSKTHAYGWDAEKAVENAREKIAKLINAHPKEIFFTSGATESNNMSLKGVINFLKSNKNKKNHVITTTTEHKCVLDSCRYLENRGAKITYLPVDTNGLINPNQVKEAITDKTAIVSVMSVNNEIGVIQPIKEIGKICRENKVYFHTDAAQAFGKIPIDVNEMNIDLMSISGHKIYGPKGIGALYLRRRPRVRIEPLMSGGGQERGLRSGTLSPALCVGFGEAANVANELLEEDNIHLEKLYTKFVKFVDENIPYTQINGHPDERYKGNVNISFGFVEGESLLMALKSIALSSGSACTSSSLEPSYVLRSLGVDETMSHTSIRFGFGRYTTEEEVDNLCNLLKEKVEYLRNLSPLWEMHNEGIDIKTIKWDHH